MASEQALAFGPFRLIPSQKLLLENDKPVRLGSRALELLIALVERASEVVSRDELVAYVWPSTVVEETSLRVHIAALRKALGEQSALLAGNSQRSRVERLDTGCLRRLVLTPSKIPAPALHPRSSSGSSIRSLPPGGGGRARGPAGRWFRASWRSGGGR